MRSYTTQEIRITIMAWKKTIKGMMEGGLISKADGKGILLGYDYLLDDDITKLTKEDEDER